MVPHSQTTGIAGAGLSIFARALGMAAIERINVDPGPEQSPEKYRLQHLKRYEFAGDYVKGKSVVDVACGTGYGSEMLALAGARDVRGIDLSPDAVEYAIKMHHRPNIVFETGDATDLSRLANASIDAVVSFETIEHLPEPLPFLREAARILRPGGSFLVSTPCRWRGSLEDKPANPHHVREWNLPEFRALLLDYFREIELFGQIFYLSQGFPLSRTVANLMFPGIRESLGKLDVTPFPASKIVHFLPEYIVAVCSDPIRK